jgi:hypothetical protein
VSAAATLEDAKTSGWGIQMFATVRPNWTTFVLLSQPLTLHFELGSLLPV